MDDHFDESCILSLIAIIISSTSLQLWQNAWSRGKYVQSKPVYSNHFFAAKNRKKEQIVRKK